jgi:hypothetical protein
MGSCLFIQSDLTCVTIVLPNGNQREAGRLGNGAVGGSTLLDGLGVSGTPDELGIVFA